VVTDLDDEVDVRIRGLDGEDAVVDAPVVGGERGPRAAVAQASRHLIHLHVLRDAQGDRDVPLVDPRVQRAW
jgi:hypothetical protein